MKTHALWQHRRHRRSSAPSPSPRCAAERRRRRADASEQHAPTCPAPSTAPASSAQGAAQEAWIAAFQTANPDVTVNYDPQGSGAGRETFIVRRRRLRRLRLVRSRTTRSPAAVRRAAPPAPTSIDLPVYISPIAVIFNVEGVDELNLDAATIAGIFAGTITNWNDPAIAATNDGATLPDLADHRRAPLGRLGHHEELHRLPRTGRARRLDRTAGRRVAAPGR